MRVRVEAERESASYDVLIEAGALSALGELVHAAAPAHRYVVITDSNVERHWGATVLSAMRAAGRDAALLSFAAGEANKTRDSWSELTDRLLALGAGRDTAVIALGGGVVGDVAGFVAATYMRGLRCVQVPTTLLAMIDASVGGKTGVDTPVGKNLIGAFHQPALVVIDPLTLATLPEAERINGMAEAIKHGAIADRSYFDWLASQVASLSPADAERFTRLIADSVRIKAGFVSADPYETGARAALNFGHTIGHALELASNYELPHGHAVAIGMLVETSLGERMGITAQGTADRIRTLVESAGLTSRPDRQHVASISALVKLDKKARAGRARYVLLSEIGAVARGPAGDWTFDVDPSLVSTVLGDTLEA